MVVLSSGSPVFRCITHRKASKQEKEDDRRDSTIIIEFARDNNFDVDVNLVRFCEEKEEEQTESNPYRTHLGKVLRATGFVLFSPSRKLIGFVLGYDVLATHRNTRVIEIGALLVCPEHRRRGHGSRLVDLCIEQFARRGIPSVCSVCHTNQRDGDSIPFWRYKGIDVSFDES